MKKTMDRYSLQLAAVLFVYACYHAIAEHIFFEGFLFNIGRLNNVVFGRGQAPGLFAGVPYRSSSIFLAALSNPWFTMGLLLFYIPLLIKRKQLKNITFEKPDRIIIFIAALALAWELSTYDYNYYLDHAFYLDRLILVVLALLLLRYPLLSPLFVAFAFVYRSQFNYPVDGFPLFDKRLLFDVQIMFVAHTCLRLFVPSFRISLLYLLLCMVGANYFMTGVKKLSMQPHIYGWVLYNKPGDLFANVHYRGWLAHVSDERILSIASHLSGWGVPLQLLVLLIELSGILLLRSRRLAIPLLIVFTCMHIGIFLLGSMLFWKWMLLDIALACILIFGSVSIKEELFSKRGFKASMIVMMLSPIWLKPIMIGWYDTPVNQFFSYEVITRDNRVYELNKNAMNPYHQWFQFDNFLFLVNKPCLRVTGFGYTNKFSIVSAIRQASPGGYAALEAREGVNVYNGEKKKAFDEFIKVYFTNRNRRIRTVFFPTYFKAPNHLYSANATSEYDNTAPVKTFRMYLNQVYTLNGKKTLMNKQLIDEIFIPN
ncbi:MAG: hypothetical protein JSS82_08805 [Bacteroidetes bacterium]|nr:hypothetical protein [Bacteroidota bacterium]